MRGCVPHSAQRALNERRTRIGRQRGQDAVDDTGVAHDQTRVGHCAPDKIIRITEPFQDGIIALGKTHRADQTVGQGPHRRIRVVNETQPQPRGILRIHSRERLKRYVADTDVRIIKQWDDGIHCFSPVDHVESQCRLCPYSGIGMLEKREVPLVLLAGIGPGQTVKDQHERFGIFLRRQRFD